MLPNLRDIRWLNASTEHLELTLPLIVSSALTDFRLGFDTHGPSDASQVVPALEALAPAYDSLVAVRICHSTIHDPRIIRAASDLLLKCNPDRLRDFYVISVLFAEAFVHASQLPNLESFVIRTDTTDLQVSLPAPAFPSLEWLEIDAVNTRSPLIQTISHVQSRAFFRLQLEFPAATSGTFLPTTLAALRPRGLHETLTVLAIHPKGDFDLDGTTVRPILFLNQLTDLEITLICADRCAYKLSDENLDELVRAMPKLKQLSLGPFPCTRLVDNTIKSLTSAAKHCKHLEHLAIHINVVAVVTGVFQGGDRDQNRAPDDSLSVFAGCPLRSIILGRCFIPNEEQGAVIFALTLLRLFPHLRSFAVAQLNRDEDPLWDIVEGVITTHRRIRINIADAGKLTNSFPGMKLAYVLQLLAWKQTKPCARLLSFLGSHVSWIPVVLYVCSKPACTMENVRNTQQITVYYCTIVTRYLILITLVPKESVDAVSSVLREGAPVNDHRRIRKNTKTTYDTFLARYVIFFLIFFVFVFVRRFNVILPRTKFFPRRATFRTTNDFLLKLFNIL